jgi:hypothetical protein
LLRFTSFHIPSETRNDFVRKVDLSGEFTSLD